MNALELTNAVLLEMKSVPTVSLSTVVGDQKLALAWVNRAIQDIATKPVQWKFSRVRGKSFALSPGKEEYTAAEMYIGDLDTFDLDSFSIGTKRLTQTQYEIIKDKTAVGSPLLVCSPESNVVRFSPIPKEEKTITFDYFRTHPVLTSSLETPLIPAKYHYLIVCFALMHYAAFDDAPEIDISKTMGAARMYKQMFNEQAIVRERGAIL
jgi:hypothetical protein